jgi:hypothetical protein
MLTIRKWSAGAFMLAVAGVMTLAGCSAADGVPGSCSGADDCDRGTICAGGVCEEADCEEDSDCASGEVCLLVDGDGNYDPNADGFCTAVECGDSPLPNCGRGESCIDGVCYDEGSDNTCDCSDDCGSGEICFRGDCREPLNSCSTDCECVVGETCTDGTCSGATAECDPACGEGETCVDGACQGATACDPVCGTGETCVDGACQTDGSSGALCATCTQDSECGGANDLCVTVVANGADFSFCGVECVDNTGCPSGFTCFEAVVGSPKQCRPVTNSCEGCLGTGCDDGQFCNPVSNACQAFGEPCDACQGTPECVSGASCAEFAGSRFCLTQCTEQSQCGADEECRIVGSEQLCAPTSNSCGGAACTVTAAECTAAGKELNTDLCACVDCGADTDCETGQICNPDGECIFAGGPCARITDCPAGICDTRIGRCVECLTPGDCAAGQVCAAGLCTDCTCPAGQRCDVGGACVDFGGGDPSSCTSDSECETFAAELGYAGSDARCDSGTGGVGCYIAGICNGAASGLPIDIGGFGGETDVFGATCAPGSSCNFRLDLLGGIGGGSAFTFACTGCDPSDASTCREGESCTTPLFPIPDDTPSCTSGGGGGFPFPFP